MISKTLKESREYYRILRKYNEFNQNSIFFEKNEKKLNLISMILVKFDDNT